MSRVSAATDSPGHLQIDYYIIRHLIFFCITRICRQYKLGICFSTVGIERERISQFKHQPEFLRDSEV